MPADSKFVLPKASARCRSTLETVLCLVPIFKSEHLLMQDRRLPGHDSALEADSLRLPRVCASRQPEYQVFDISAPRIRGDIPSSLQ